MSLPKIDVPIYELTLPSTEQLVKYRPFLVKEEKVLMMAAESKDDKDMINAVKQIINNCCLTEEIKIDSLSSFDLEYFFIQLRARSSGETVSLLYPCEKESCKEDIPFDVDLTKVEVFKNPDHTTKVELTDDIGIMMKYPQLRSIGKINSDSEVESTFQMIIDCIDYIYDDEEIHKAKDATKKELREWIEGLSQENFIKVRTFFETMPKVKYDVELKCGKCKTVNKIEIEGMNSFFG
jgi:hypothetical protein